MLYVLVVTTCIYMTNVIPPQYVHVYNITKCIIVWGVIALPGIDAMYICGLPYYSNALGMHCTCTLISTCMCEVMCQFNGTNFNRITVYLQILCIVCFLL